VLTFIWVALGFVFKIVVMKVELTMMKGSPTVEDMLAHIQDAFPVFWKIVFEDLESGLAAFWFASIVFLLGMIIMTFYEVFVCICKLYQPREEKPLDEKDSAGGI